MNSYELADYLEVSPNMTVFKAAAVLRQQAKELVEAGGMIGVLREYISDLENGLDSSIKLNKAQAERNNEPVVWTACLDCGKRVTGNSIHTCSPQLKQLTDEEIAEVFFGLEVGHSATEFARAILRKAKEK